LTYTTVGASFQLLYREEADSAQVEVCTQTSSEDEQIGLSPESKAKTPELAIYNSTTTSKARGPPPRLVGSNAGRSVDELYARQTPPATPVIQPAPVSVARVQGQVESAISLVLEAQHPQPKAPTQSVHTPITIQGSDRGSGVVRPVGDPVSTPKRFQSRAPRYATGESFLTMNYSLAPPN
jgi:hypothetical protein